MTKPDLFTTIYQQNRKRIHYHINALMIRDPEHEFFQMGTIALWEAYRKYDPDKGPMSTYFNFIIRNRLIDHIRKQSANVQTTHTMLHTNQSITTDHDKTHPHTSIPNLDDLIYSRFTTNHRLLDFVKSHFTYHQWLWFNAFILNNQTIKEIAADNDTSTDAVKGWQRQARKKLNTTPLKDTIMDEFNS